MSTINISEVFGPTIQGEGIYTGIPSIFVRLNGCNLCCCFGDPQNGICRSVCDTPYTSIRPDKDTSMDINELARQVSDMIDNMACPHHAHVVITGGEPLTQQDKLIEFLSKLDDKQLGRNITVTIETNGSIEPDLRLLCRVNLWSVSPKLLSSCCFVGSQIPEARQRSHKAKRINYAALLPIIMTEHYQLKFVYSGPSCVDEIKTIIKGTYDHAMELSGTNIPQKGRYSNAFSQIDDHILLMPEGATRDQLNTTSESAALAAIENGWRYCDRTHIRVWNDKRKV